jgi:hypothetical protein
LGKRHDAKLLGAIHTSNAGIPSIAIYDAAEAPPWNEIHDLCEERLADIHSVSPRALTPGNSTKIGARGKALWEFGQASRRRLILQEVVVRDFKSTAHEIERNALQILGFSNLTDDLTGQ